MMSLIIVAVCFGGADDLDSLRKQYEAKKVEVARERGENRKGAIEKKVVPILVKIAELKTRPAVEFLSQLVHQEMPDLAEAACGPLAQTNEDAAVDSLLKAAQSRPPSVREAALTALRSHKVKLAEPHVAAVLALIAGASPEALKLAGVAALGEQDTLAAARALVQALAAPKLEPTVALAIDRALLNFKAKEALEYFYKDALGGGAKAPRQLVALLRLAAAKKAKEAADAAKKLVDHPSPEVAGAAIAAVAAVGFQGGRDQILSLLKKHQGNLDVAVDILSGLAESGSAEAGGVLVEVSRQFTGAIQIVAVSLLGRAKSSEALDRLIEVLADKDVAVRTAAMKAVTEYKDKRIIGPLIGVMEREEGRLRGEAYKFLVQITGQSMGPTPEDWRKWWSYAEKEFAFNPKEEGRTTVKGAAYYGIEIFSKQLCFIIDCSSSMTGKVIDPATKKESTRIELAKKELSKALKELKLGTMVNIISFNASFTPMAKQLAPLTKASLVKALGHVRDLKTATGTNIYDTLSAALKDKSVDTIFLLSDGQPTQGRYTDPATVAAEIRKQNLTRNVTINTIAIGIEQELMKQLAKESGGKYVFVKD